MTEELKEKAPMQWVGLMTNIRSQAEVQDELREIFEAQYELTLTEDRTTSGHATASSTRPTTR